MISVKNYFRLIFIGFAKSPLAGKLPGIVAIKPALIFLVLKLFFFQDYLESKFDTDYQKGNYVNEHLIISGR